MEPSRPQRKNDPPASQPWAAHATRWNRLGPPLRPCEEDLQRMQAAWSNSLRGNIPDRRMDVLSLGVTPEIALYPWAAEISLTAIDASEEMIRTVWPGDRPDRKAVRGDWLRMPFAGASFDLILCDAGLAPLAGVGTLAALGAELHRVLRPDGRAVMRHFARPNPAESEDSILVATVEGRIHNFHELKLRLLMAIESQAPALGVRLGDAWDRFECMFRDRALLAGRLGCDVETIATIDAYRGRDARYSFPTPAEVAEALGTFRLEPGPPGHYPLADCCPVFSLEPEA